MSREDERRWCSSRGVPDELDAHDDAGRASSVATMLAAAPAGGAISGAVSGAEGSVSGVSIGAGSASTAATSASAGTIRAIASEKLKRVSRVRWSYANTRGGTRTSTSSG